MIYKHPACISYTIIYCVILFIIYASVRTLVLLLLLLIHGVRAAKTKLIEFGRDVWLAVVGGGGDERKKSTISSSRRKCDKFNRARACPFYRLYIHSGSARTYLYVRGLRPP